MGSIKDRKCRDLTEAEKIKKRWQEYTEEWYKKDLHDPENHDGVSTHLEPDILECEVKWALEASLWTKLVEVMEFQLSYFKSWKMTLWKCFTQYASKFGKLSGSHRTGNSSMHSSPKESEKWSESEVAHLCQTLCDPMDYSLWGSTNHGNFQVRILEWAVVSFFRGIFLNQGLNLGL